MGMSFSGFEEFDTKLEEISKGSQQKIDQFAVQEAEILLGKAKDNTPTDTGNLKNAWKRTRPQNGSVTVYNNTEYAADVEYGHRQTPGRFVPAIGKRLKKSYVPGKKMLHLGLLQTNKTFKADAEQIIKDLIDK